MVQGFLDKNRIWSRAPRSHQRVLERVQTKWEAGILECATVLDWRTDYCELFLRLVGAACWEMVARYNFAGGGGYKKDRTTHPFLRVSL